MTAMDLLQDPDFLAEFVTEAMENLSELDGLFVALERQPDDRATLAAVFRGIHTIKGTSGFLALPRIEQLSHAGEDLLSLLRDGRLRLDMEKTTCLLTLMDRLREILDVLATAGVEPEGDDTALLDMLHRLATPPEVPADSAGAAQVAGPSTGTPSAGGEPSGTSSDGQAGTITPNGDGSGRFGQLLIELGLATQFAIDRALTAQRNGDTRRIGEILVAEGLLHPDQLLQVVDEQARRVSLAARIASAGVANGPPPVTPAAKTPSPATVDHADGVAGQSGSVPGATGASGGSGDSTVRLDVGVLDGLVDLVGELVLARNRLLLDSGDQIAASAREIDRLTSDLQHQVLRTRVQQVRVAWAKVPRIARDTAMTLHKRVRVEMDGESTELDRSLVEAVKDPLMHLVRNAVDHGIETPDARTAAGKDPEGTVRLSARQQGGDVVMEISDDGAGMDPARMRDVAVRRGVITAEAAALLPDEDSLNLIFEPGFSTAATVTNISGRGVGMDVVRTTLQSLGGSLDVHSTVGRGSTFTMRIPLTLAIMPALVVSVQTRRYVLPEAAVTQIVRLRTKDDVLPLDRLPDGLCLRWRDRLLPVVDLTEVMDGWSAAGGTGRRSHVVVVVQAQGRRLGLLVDAALEIEEVVVKSLAAAVNPHALYSGATILGDGAIAPILDVAGLVRLTGLMGIPATDDDDDTDRGRAHRLLVCLADGHRYALPADHVRHVVRVPLADVHWHSGAGTVVRIGEELHAVRALTGEFGEHGRWLSLVQITSEVDAPRTDVELPGDGAGDGLGTTVLVDTVLDVIATPATGVDASGDVTSTVLLDGEVVDVLDPALLAIG